MKVKFICPVFFNKKNYFAGKEYEVKDDELDGVDEADYVVLDEDGNEPKKGKGAPKAASKGAPKDAENK